MADRMAETQTRLIAFYLPQFHPTPENDEWWGKGFTEWTNVAKAKPLFRGHYQPRVPADLGFYDLRVPETRAAQAEMAKEHGIEAFCYYHYWFAGRRILERPFNEVLRSGEPDFPFCLCWANQTWTGIWHGCPGKVLVEQTYPGYEDYLAHFYTLLKAFSDSRYVTVDGKPLFLIFDPMNIPEIEKLTDFWRELALKSGLKGLYLVGMAWAPDWNPVKFGFDAATPLGKLPKIRQYRFMTPSHTLNRLWLKYYELTGKPTVYLHEKVLSAWMYKDEYDYEHYPCVLPNWDNTSRSGANGLVLHGSTPELFRIPLRNAIELMRNKPEERRLVFIKSWNEWAEGNYLEPDLKFGRSYLEVVREEVFRHE
ncbi:glycoside hydrolase family 99-like domain-containing protein [Geobacter sp.]|uniref:glycosyltransferase WbsX family protein n=1 Tax=Geobacter sp. TaxID=46610 RepID=UPI00262480DC|nr:glycoside hydrolase family 99-like domain-containing protein [Geobacter sp.]